MSEDRNEWAVPTGIRIEPAKIEGSLVKNCTVVTSAEYAAWVRGEPTRGQPEMTVDPSLRALAGFDALRAGPTEGHARDHIAKLEAENEVMRRTIRRLADENAMLQMQMAEVGLAIYGTDTPECPDQNVAEPDPQSQAIGRALSFGLATGPQGMFQP